MDSNFRGSILLSSCHATLASVQSECAASISTMVRGLEPPEGGRSVERCASAAKTARLAAPSLAVMAATHILHPVPGCPSWVMRKPSCHGQAVMSCASRHAQAVMSWASRLRSLAVPNGPEMPPLPAAGWVMRLSCSLAAHSAPMRRLPRQGREGGVHVLTRRRSPQLTPPRRYSPTIIGVARSHRTCSPRACRMMLQHQPPP